MRVRMLRLVANPQVGTYQPGSVVDLPDEMARKRIAAGHCAPVEEAAPEPVKPVEPVEAKPVDQMTIPELRTYAAEHGIDLGDATLKRDILAAIERAQDED